ncbi:SufE family protein [Methylacidiphilum caldifontis]|uniref:Fe-S metabolism protein SufE n=1 Tax=Methylacidiphilum caldifontis TaxID=2795386 RepID=A0A4Y8P775_9BACT|nr:SufE family protein [Methylacidiphilum caldifontis]QSR88939.1 SufE family protein [Methylacidiphilum caldifontis]TFE66160.1 Fe-S metabolism protein SufE [Methylacidiphilum caldifontis]
MEDLPKSLRDIISTFEVLGEEERREMLIAYSEAYSQFSPKEDERYVLTDVRKDEECTDTVGVYLLSDEEGKVYFRMHLGPHVQTLTKAMTSILCQGLNGSFPQQIIEMPSTFISKIVGGELFRIRSQTVYYVLGRMKNACKQLLNKNLAQNGH